VIYWSTGMLITNHELDSKLSTSSEQTVQTHHPVDKLLEQYKSAAGLLQLVRFYECTLQID
jgi:hypothetical protein